MSTLRHRLFADEYLVDLNITQAAIRAGYSPKTAYAIGFKLLKNAEIRALIDEKAKKRELESGVDAAWLLKDLATQAKADINDLYTESGELKPIREWPMVWRTGLVAGIDTSQSIDVGGAPVKITRVRLADRIRVRELLGKHVTIQAWVDKKEIGGKDGGPVVVQIDRSIL